MRIQPAPAILHRKTKGDIAEAYVTARLLELGLTVLRPVGDNARFDLVVHHAENGGFLRVQCKTAFPDPRAANVIKFAVCSAASRTNAGKRDYRGEIDLFGVYYPANRSVYLVPVEDVGTSEASLRLGPTRNGQARGIRLAANYLV